MLCITMPLLLLPLLLLRGWPVAPSVALIVCWRVEGGWWRDLPESWRQRRGWRRIPGAVLAAGLPG